MIQNEEKFRELIKRTFEKFISKFSWEDIQEVWSVKPSLKKASLQGGYREKKDNIGHFRSQIIKKYDEELAGFLFRFWEKKYKSEWLSKYLNSGEYKQWKEEQKEIQTDFTFGKKSFGEFLRNEGNESVLFYIFFSKSLKFSDEQINETWSVYEKAGEEKNETERQNKDFLSIKEIKRLQKETKFLKSKLEQAELLISTKSEQINKLIQEKNHLKQKAEERYKKDSMQMNERIAELEQETLSLSNELQKKDVEIEKFNKLRTDTESHVRNLRLRLEKERTNTGRLFQGVIERMDTKSILESCNEQDEIKKLLASVVCLPDSDREIENELNENYFYDFWKIQVENEMRIIEKITNYNLGQILNGNFVNGEWDPDNFNDMKYSLQARAFLINLFYEIIREYISDSFSQINRKV